LIQQVYISFEDALRERNLTLDRVDLETLPIVEADGDELSKVFQNLVSNAIKYTPDGKQITISGKAWSGKKAGIALDFVEVIISDTGIGIDPQSHELIFTKFYQAGNVAFHSSGKTKFKGGGPGLGLAMSRGIVEAHGGRIWVESPGYDEQTCPGSRFHVVLPQHRPPQGTEVRGVTATP
jgi:signal transduction histidine kinase